jgi:hypothetical protein
MVRIVIGFVAALVLGNAAHAQAPAQVPTQPQMQAIGEQAKRMIGTWEFSTAERDKICSVTFKADRAGSGYKLEFDSKCLDDFPLLRDVIGWTYPDGDLLSFVDVRGKSLVEFSEVETGMYEAPTPGVGVLFLQNSADAGSKPVLLDQVTGDWALMRGAGKPLCTLTLTTDSTDDGFVLKVGTGCDPSVVRVGFARWKLDRNELMIAPARGNPWRFEQEDANTWERVPESVNPYRLVRQ